MIVVSIIALLAVIAVPSFLRARQQAQNAKFINALRVASGALELYAMEHNGAYPPDTNRGVVPPALLQYLDPTLDFTAQTPIGGKWDWDFNVFGTRAAISVVDSRASTEQMTQIDENYDDGDLSSGRFQAKANGRYSEIIEK